MVILGCSEQFHFPHTRFDFHKRKYILEENKPNPASGMFDKACKWTLHD